MNRPTTDEYFIRMAQLVSTRSTCYRRHVGCVLVNTRNHVLATGYNGVATGLPHCSESKSYRCIGRNAISGSNLDDCQAIHAEQNALLQCPNVFDIKTAYTTTAPCRTCVKLLMGTTCTRIVFLEEYPHKESEQLWSTDSSRSWIHFYDLGEIN